MSDNFLFQIGFPWAFDLSMGNSLHRSIISFFANCVKTYLSFFLFVVFCMSTKKKVNLYVGAPDGAVVELIWVDIWVRGSRQTPPLFLPITLLSSRLSLRFDID